MQLYHALRSDSQDYRLKVFRQARKRDVLPPGMDEAGIAALAAGLDVKPLDAWMQTWIQRDFGHVAGLTARDAAQLLARLGAVRHLLSGIRTRTDALLLLRCLDTVGSTHPLRS